MLTRKAPVLVALLVLLVTTIAAQQLPPRDAGEAQKGSGVMRGIVIDAQTSAPLPRATVMALGEGVRLPLFAQTDGEGRFELRDLQPNKYRLSAERMPYISMSDGQAPGSPRPTLVEIGRDQVIEKVIIALQPGGVIAGRVFDEFGHPAVNVPVHAMQYRFENGVRRLAPAFTAGSTIATNDLGAFRLYGLRPGQYFVAAMPRSIRTNGPVEEKAGSVTTYFPNTTDSASAQRVAVAAAQEVAGINIVLASGRLATLRGRAVTSSGEPFAGGMVSIEKEDSSWSFSGGAGGVRPDGSFEVTGVPAGEYVLSVRALGDARRVNTEIARMRVAVTGEDIGDLLLVGRGGTTVRGVVVTDEGATPLIKPSQVQLRVAYALDNRGPYVQPTVHLDSTFEIAGLFGRGRIEGSVMPFSAEARDAAPWGVKHVYWRGDDITESWIDFDAHQSIDGIEVVLSRRWAELSGTVTNSKGQPAADTALVLFPAEDSRWTDPGRVRLVRTAENGTYRAAMLRAGDYLVAQIGIVESGQWRDPDVLRLLAERATRLSIADGEKKTLDLRITSR